MTGNLVLVSSGTLLAVAGLAMIYDDAPMLTGALYYMFASTLGLAALFLLAEPIGRKEEGIAGLLAVLLGMIAFWTLETDGLTMLYVLVSSFLSGALVPVSVFPGGLRTLVQWLPFQATTYVPASIYVGGIEGADALRAVGVQLGWVVLLGVGAALVWRRAVRRVVVQGG